MTFWLTDSALLTVQFDPRKWRIKRAVRGVNKTKRQRTRVTLFWLWTFGPFVLCVLTQRGRDAGLFGYAPGVSSRDRLRRVKVRHALR